MNINKIISVLLLLICFEVSANPKFYFPENREVLVKPRYQAKPYAHIDFSKGQFSNHEYALKEGRSVAITFGLKF